jgi:hypothetical protein
LTAFSKKKLAIIALDEHSHHFADGITPGGGSIDNHNDGNKIFLTATEALSEKIPPFNRISAGFQKKRGEVCSTSPHAFLP